MANLQAVPSGKMLEAPENGRVGYVPPKLMEFQDGAEPHDDICLNAISCG